MIEPKKAPDGMPQLSRGKHRSPKTGACFMEFASFLAGEPWSDSPQCTDPMLAHLARSVNDQLSDARRDELAPDIPRVVGLRGDHRVLAPVVALRAAANALPIVAAGRQQALAVALLSLPASCPPTSCRHSATTSTAPSRPPRRRRPGLRGTCARTPCARRTCGRAPPP